MYLLYKVIATLLSWLKEKGCSILQLALFTRITSLLPVKPERKSNLRLRQSWKRLKGPFIFVCASSFITEKKPSLDSLILFFLLNNNQLALFPVYMFARPMFYHKWFVEQQGMLYRNVWA